LKKTGFLNYFQEIDGSIVSTVPVYLTLSKQSLRVYNSVDASSMITHIKLDSIQRIDQTLLKTFCFDIIVNEVVKLKVLEISKIILCAYNDKEMHNWIKAILEFKECSIKKLKTDHNGKVLIDFSQINSVLNTKENVKEMDMENLYYDGTDTPFKRNVILSRDKAVNKDMTEIQEIMNLGKIAKLQLKRRLRGRLARTRMSAGAILRKEGLIKSLVEQRMEAVKKQENFLLKKENQNRKKRLLSNLKEKIKKLKV
jgi:hypothetical protein